MGDPAKVVALAAVYVVVARLGLMLDAVGGGFATLVWPATGISLAALLQFGGRLWPGVALGAFAANLLTGASIPVALGIATGNTLEAVVGAYALVRVVEFRGSFDKLREVLGLIVLAAVGSTILSASIGVVSLLLGGFVTTRHIGETWLAWWVGDLIADLVITPMLLAWANPRGAHAPPKRPLEALAVAASVVALTALIYGSPPGVESMMSMFRQSYMVFPLLIWAALRLGPREGTTTTFAVVALAIVGTAFGRGPFIQTSLHQSLFALQTFMAVSAATFLVLIASISERRQAAYALRAAQEGLETTVRARTMALTEANAELVDAKEALSKARDELELRVEERTQQIRKLLDKLEEAVQARDALISIASHELRTPLSALQLQVVLISRELAKDKSPNAIAAPLVARLASVDRQVGRLSRLVENLLDVSRITAGKLQLEYEEFDLASTAREVVSRFEDEVRRAGSSIVLESKTPITGRWDRIRLEQVLTNLISNAIKYGENRPIEIALESLGGDARITVKDYGIGIAIEDCERIFKRFERLVSGKHSGGFGLGLWIVREIVQALGGTIRVESEIGAGAKFVVVVPRRREPQQVLVVEDDPDVLDAVTGALRAEGYAVESAVNGQKAMEYLTSESPPCVILLDLMMPVMDGREFLDMKRKVAGLAQIPVVLISADSQLERRARELQVEEYLRKPVHLDALLSTVARHCSTRAASGHIKL